MAVFGLAQHVQHWLKQAAARADTGASMLPIAWHPAPMQMHSKAAPCKTILALRYNQPRLFERASELVRNRAYNIINLKQICHSTDHQTTICKSWDLGDCLAEAPTKMPNATINTSTETQVMHLHDTYWQLGGTSTLSCAQRSLCNYFTLLARLLARLVANRIEARMLAEDLVCS